MNLFLIVDNLCKIVEDPTTMIPIMSKSEPLEKAMCEQYRRSCQSAFFVQIVESPALGCDAYNALTWSQRQSGGSHTNLLFDR